MAKETLIRQKCVKELKREGWVICAPVRARHGSSRTYYKGKMIGSDDIFSIFDLVAWHDSPMRFIQYTSTSNFSTRVKKIQKFIKENKLSMPPHCTAEVWGYKDREGFTRKEYVQ